MGRLQARRLGRRLWSRGGSKLEGALGARVTIVPDASLSLGQLVLDRGLAPAETLARAQLVQGETGERLDSVLTRLGLVSEQALAQAIAEAAGLRVASRDDYPDEPIAADRLSARFLHDAKAVPLRLTEAGVEVAFVDPFDPYPSAKARASKSRVRLERSSSRSTTLSP